MPSDKRTMIVLERLDDGRWTCAATWRGLPDSRVVPKPPGEALASAALSLSELEWQHAHDQRVPAGIFEKRDYNAIAAAYVEAESVGRARAMAAEEGADA